MLTLNDGRAELWQWDTGRTLAVYADCSQVHFSNKVFGRSIDVDVVDGVAVIPDILLQTDKDLNVWAFVGTAENGYTKISKTFKINRRNKPADYVFTPTEQMTLQMIQRQIGDLADLTTESKDTLVAAINEAARTGGGAGSMELRVADGYVQYSADGGMTWTNLIAIADLKGDPGEPGKDGHSPAVTATKSGKTTTISVDGAAIATVEDGADGASGSRGADGITPTIGSNGNWYLGDTDTGKPSRGEKGDEGQPGKDGQDGSPGKDGADGQPGENGADGYSPTANVTQNDNGATITITDKNGTTTATVTNGKDGADGNPGADGSPGADGADGKTAYAYAVEGGFTGTETEFSEKLAQEQLTGTTNDLTPTQVYNAVSAGIPVKVQRIDSTYGIISFTAFAVSESLNTIASNMIAYYNGVYILTELVGDKSENVWFFMSTTLAQKQDIPTTLPNPNALTFTGAVTGSYDGSNAKTVNIPSAVTDDHINSLIDTKLGVIENGAY